MVRMTNAVRRWVLGAIGVCVAGILAFGLAPCAAAADTDKAAEDALKEKGLTKTGITWVLEEDAKLPEEMRKFRKAKTDYDAENRKRLDVERQIKNAKGTISQLEFEYRKLNEKLASMDKNADAFQYNQTISKINQAVSHMKEGQKFIEEREGELKKFHSSRDAYVTATQELFEKLKAMQKQYEDLAKDADVKGALDRVNEKAKPRNKLGPSPEFAANLQFVTAQESLFNSGNVKVTVERNIPHVDVTLNGKLTKSMVLDSGAGLIALTAGSARELGLNPGEKDPTIRMTLADGKMVEGKLMSLKTVRVGKFTVDNVECAVLPASLVAAEDLLGGSFLRNFVYKLDPQAGELHLTQVGKPGGK